MALKILLKDWFYLSKNIHQINLIFGKDKIMERYGRFPIKIWKGEFSSLSTTCNTRIQEGLEFLLIHNPCPIKGRFFPHSSSWFLHGFHTILTKFFLVFQGALNLRIIFSEKPSKCVWKLSHLPWHTRSKIVPYICLVRSTKVRCIFILFFHQSESWVCPSLGRLWTCVICLGRRLRELSKCGRCV